MKDAEIVLEYAIENFIISKANLSKQEIKSKIMVHGESLGGMVASYVTMKSNSNFNKNIPVDFAFINRTYASLDNVSYWASGINILNSFLNGSS